MHMLAFPEQRTHPDYPPNVVLATGFANTIRIRTASREIPYLDHLLDETETRYGPQTVKPVIKLHSLLK